MATRSENGGSARCYFKEKPKTGQGGKSIWMRGEMYYRTVTREKTEIDAPIRFSAFGAVAEQLAAIDLDTWFKVDFDLEGNEGKGEHAGKVFSNFTIRSVALCWPWKQAGGEGGSFIAPDQESDLPF